MDLNVVSWIRPICISGLCFLSLLPRDAMLVQYMLSSYVRLSVCLFVRPKQPVLYIKTAKHITETTPYDSSRTPVFRCQRYWRNSNVVTFKGAPNTGGLHFRPVSRYILETVQDRDIVTISVWIAGDWSWTP